MPARTRLLALALCAAALADCRVVTLRNDVLRLDVNGEPVDAHDGCLVAHGGTYFLYGERYGNLTGADFANGGWGAAPQLAVYTSPDLEAWTYRGALFNMSVPADKSFTKWIPTAVYSPACACFVLWFGSGAWATATSVDGIHFDLAARSTTSRLGGGTDGTGLLLDADGTGYVAFAALETGGSLNGGHLVSIERLSPDLLSSSGVNVSGFFPLDYVESPALFRRAGRYYLATGSCCCACRGGGGLALDAAGYAAVGRQLRRRIRAHLRRLWRAHDWPRRARVERAVVLRQRDSPRRRRHGAAAQRPPLAVRRRRRRRLRRHVRQWRRQRAVRQPRLRAPLRF